MVKGDIERQKLLHLEHFNFTSKNVNENSVSLVIKHICLSTFYKDIDFLWEKPHFLIKELESDVMNFDRHDIPFNVVLFVSDGPDDRWPWTLHCEYDSLLP